MLFADKSNKREIPFYLRVNSPEEKYLKERAQAEGITVTALVRKCLRIGLGLEQSPSAEATPNPG